MKLTYLKQCPVCLNEFTTSSQSRRTCSRPCARVLSAASWWFFDDEYKESRLHLVRQILKHPARHTRSQLKWASRAMASFLRTGEVPPPTSRYTQRASHAKQVMLEAMGEEGMAEVVRRATEETVE
jgi:hypothetical protein